MVKTKCFAKMKNGLLAKLFGAAVLSVGLIALAGTKAMAATETENNGTVSTANVVPVNEAVSANISTADDMDWFKFTLTEPGSLSVSFWHETCNAGDYDWMDTWKLTLYGGDERDIEYCTMGIKSGDEKTDRSSIYNVPAGTYYIKVKSDYYWRSCEYKFTINYESSVEKNEEQEMNDSPSTSNSIAVNTSYHGRISLGEDADWYKFTVTEPGSVSVSFWHETCNAGDYDWMDTWKVDLFRGEETDVHYSSMGIKSGDEKIDTTSIHNIPAGTYYIRIKPDYYWRNCDYSVIVNYESSVGKDMEQESNDTPSTANLISVNKNYSGRVSLEKDLDWYAFDLAESSTVTVTLSHDVIDSSGYYWNVRVYDNAEMTNELLNCHWQGNKE